MTGIEWTEQTWNPTTGCDKVSPGCDRCYALTLAGRLKAMGQAKYQNDGDPATSGPGFALTLHPDTLDVPLRRKKPTTYFVNSMSDLFHPDVPQEFLYEVFAIMVLAEQHTFQILTKWPQRMAQLFREAWTIDEIEILTKRPQRMAQLFREAWTIDEIDTCRRPLSFDRTDWPRPNVWLGTSIENDRYTFRANHLRATPAAVRFLSLEPLLGPLPSLNLDQIDWVIVGAESGHGARPMNLDWVRPIRDACVERSIPFFLKQTATAAGRKISLPELDGQVWAQTPGHP